MEYLHGPMENNFRNEVTSKAKQLARAYKLQGFHCSESIIRACSQALGLSLSEDVIRCASGFRGGGGGYGDRCGVIESGCMLISYLYGRLHPTQEIESYSFLIRTLHERFADAFQSIYCREIVAREELREDLTAPKCMHTYELGAEIISELLLDADQLLKVNKLLEK